jgi:DNA-binding NarL/FixJ family response regulator
VIRLFIADDHPVVRAGLRGIIEGEPGFEVVGEAANGHDLLATIGRTPAEVLLLDVSMPGPGFLEVLRDLKQDHPRLAVLVLSVHPEDQYAVRALRAGAAGYLTKDHSPEELVAAIRKVQRGGKYVSPSLAEKLAVGLEIGTGGWPHEELSNREYDVLCLLGSGRTVKEIAGRLELSPKTVSTYRARVLEKMKLASNADLVRYAAQHGLIRWEGKSEKEEVRGKR